jgi:hypothetical protein
MQSAKPGQRYIQRHEVRCPTHIDHQDQTTEDHTWAPHEELLGHDQSYERYQVSRWMAIVHHASKIFLTQPSINSNKMVNEAKNKKKRN